MTPVNLTQNHDEFINNLKLRLTKLEVIPSATSFSHLSIHPTYTLANFHILFVGSTWVIELYVAGYILRNS
jgi:hypothetical protein